MPLYNSILETIGKTPLVRLSKISSRIEATIYAKIESFNPGSSVKDRPAYNMILEAEKQGLITQESIIVETTSGNTGIGLALVCAVKGYSLRIYMPETASEERRKIMKAYGATLVLTPKEGGMAGTIEKAKEYVEKTENAFLVNQFVNKANPAIHKKTTAVEIWDDLEGKIDVFIACVGTGGTITGAGEKLKELDPNIHVIAVEPAKSSVLSGGTPGPHKIEGMGPGFIPDVLNTEIYDEIIPIIEEEANSKSRELARIEGIFAGKTAGAALAAAMKYAEKTQKEENIVIIIPDTGERYLTTELWDINE
ncbi:MAG: cysteine synthase A [Asgard group archaeon]|nr:cysteine synthase A [Asgard group archaeon]